MVEMVARKALFSGSFFVMYAIRSGPPQTYIPWTMPAATRRTFKKGSPKLFSMPLPKVLTSPWTAITTTIHPRM